MHSTAKAIRKLRGDTPQHVFAAQLGVGMSSIQRWETGKRLPTEYVHIEALVRAGLPREVATAHLTD